MTYYVLFRASVLCLCVLHALCCEFNLYLFGKKLLRAYVICNMSPNSNKTFVYYHIRSARSQNAIDDKFYVTLKDCAIPEFKLKLKKNAYRIIFEDV